MVQNARVFDILTCKCAWRHSGVPFFDNFSTSELQKVVRTRQFFNILTCKCASRYSGVQFFHIWTSKSGPPPLIFFLLTFAQLYLLSSDSTSLLCFFIFWLCYSALLFQLSILSEVRLLNFLWSLFMVPHLEPLPEILPRIARIEGHKMQEQPLLLSQNSRKNRHFPSIHNS